MMIPWTTTTQLLPHQIPAADKLLSSRVGGLYMEMGLGKTRTAIELIARRQRKIDRVVYLTLVALKATAAAEWRKHTDLPEDQIYVFDDITEGHTLPAAAVFIGGIESVSSSARVIAALRALITDRTFVVLDESTAIKGHRALRTERLTILARPARYRLILTGTPFSQGVEDLFAQLRFLDERILGYRSWRTFAANHLEYSDHIPGKIVRAHNVGLLASKIGPYVYQITKREAVNLPEKLHSERVFLLSPEQRAAYAAAKEGCFHQIETADDPAHTVYLIYGLFTTLQQIVCGFWPGCSGGPQHYPHSRLNVLDHAVAEGGPDARCIIWAKYLHCIDQIAERFVATYGPAQVVVWDGRMRDQQRHEALARWRAGARFFIATPASGGHGLTLNEAHIAIFYTNGWKYAERIQAEDRCHRIGQDQPVTYVDLIAQSTIDERIRSALRRKEGVLDAFRRRLDTIKDKSKAEVRRMLGELVQEL